MSLTAESRGRFEEARAALGKVKEQLLTPSPQTIANCSEPLAAAAESLRRLRQLADEITTEGLGEDEAASAIRGSAVALQRDLFEVHELLQQAGTFFLGWSRILESSAGTYGADGDLKAPRSKSLSLEG